MENDIKQKLYRYEKALENCGDKYNSILERSKELEKNNSIVREYKNLQLELSTLAKRYNYLRDEYTKIYRSNCEHPLWYYKNDVTNRTGVCKCVRCGIVETGSSRKFKNKLIIESGDMGYGVVCLSDYSVVRNDYIQLESSGEKEQNIVKSLIKKYNNQKKI